MRRAKVLVVDPTMCDGHGVCAELLPERVRLDRWGYPLLAPGPVPPELHTHARRAVAACPRLALTLVDAPAAPDDRPGRRHRRS